ncbi:MAG TPA: CARDB domain-containing protein, partial [Thermoleophilaceae bacterium]|nr:CARDB domain-containing protein [Thermoleophilaceae bacterium]
PAPALVKVVSCSPGEGSAVFYGRMRSVAGAERMSMRFGLLERTADGPYERVRAPRLARRRMSRPGVSVFGYRQRVKGLSEHAAYRARVDFRWHDADGDVIRRTQRRSRACSQAGPLPNLRARVAGSGATATPGVSRYSVRVVNAGEASADEVAVGFAVDGSAIDTQTVPRLEAGEGRALDFRGPRCQGSVRTTADPANGIRESSEADNSQTLTCDQLKRR